MPEIYDPEETEISKKEMINLLEESKKRGIKLAVLGGWATFFHVNANYQQAFGSSYMGSRDIDVFIDTKNDKDFLKLIEELGFTRNGHPFRWQKIYDRTKKAFISEQESIAVPMWKLIYIFLDIFSNEKSAVIQTWCDLAPLKNPAIVIASGYEVVDVAALSELKSIALFKRDKADKEDKDACDLYSLLEYCGQPVPKTEILLQAINKLIQRKDLIYYIAQQVLGDENKQPIVLASLRKRLESF